MLNDQSAAELGTNAARWAKPSFEVIPLGCEITSYAPDGNDPLF